MKLASCHKNPGRFRPSVLKIASMRCSGGDSGDTRPPTYPLLDLSDQDEGDDQRVDRDGLGETEPDQHRDEDGAADLGVASDGFHGLADAIPDPDAWAKCAQADRDGWRPYARHGTGGRLGKETDLSHEGTSRLGVEM